MNRILSIKTVFFHTINDFARPLFVALFLLLGHGMHAQDQHLFWKYKEYDGAISCSVPGWVLHLGSVFLKEKESRRLVRKINNIKVLVFENNNPFTRQDIERFQRRAKRRHLDAWLTIRDGQTRVQLYGKTRRNNIRKVVVLFESPDAGSGMVCLRGKLQLNDLKGALRQAEKQSPHKNPMPLLSKVTASKV
jgi:hypothetical protein